MTITSGPRVNVHPDRQGADRTGGRIDYIIGHTSEQSGLEDPDDAEDLARYLTSKGDRPSPSRPGEFYGASYHAITDTDRVLPCTLDTRVAYSAGGGNQYGLHICLPVRAAQTRAQWLDEGSRPYIRQFAEYIVDKATEHDIPLRHLTPGDMSAGGRGYADHATVSLAYKKSDHTDCGSSFPWDVLAADIAAITTPDQEDDMTPRYFRINDRPAVWVSTDGVTATRVDAEQYKALGNPATIVIDRKAAASFAFVDTVNRDVVA